MIKIKKSPTADTRSCDWANVSISQLKGSSEQHIGDVKKGIDYFVALLNIAKLDHDYDKIYEIKEFHKDFITGFKQTSWWDKHRKISRHHLTESDGVPDNVNLVDVIEMIVDCTMAGMARTGKVFPLEIKPEVLMKAFENTAELLKSEIIIEEAEHGRI